MYYFPLLYIFLILYFNIHPLSFNKKLKDISKIIILLVSSSNKSSFKLFICKYIKTCSLLKILAVKLTCQSFIGIWQPHWKRFKGATIATRVAGKWGGIMITLSGLYRYEFVCIWITRTQTRTDIIFCDKTRVPMFYFDSNTTRPIAPLICCTFFEKLILTGCRLV